MAHNPRKVVECAPEAIELARRPVDLDASSDLRGLVRVHLVPAQPAGIRSAAHGDAHRAERRAIAGRGAVQQRHSAGGQGTAGDGPAAPAFYYQSNSGDGGNKPLRISDILCGIGTLFLPVQILSICSIPMALPCLSVHEISFLFSCENRTTGFINPGRLTRQINWSNQVGKSSRQI